MVRCFSFSERNSPRAFLAAETSTFSSDKFRICMVLSYFPFIFRKEHAYVAEAVLLRFLTEHAYFPRKNWTCTSRRVDPWLKNRILWNGNASVRTSVPVVRFSCYFVRQHGAHAVQTRPPAPVVCFPHLGFARAAKSRNAWVFFINCGD